MMLSSLEIVELIVSISRHFLIIVGIFVIFTGVIGNTINIIVFNNLRVFRGHPSVFYFTVESIFNLAQLLINYPSRIMMDGFVIDHTNLSIVWCKTRAFFATVLSITTMYISCCASCDQFLSTHHQTSLRQISTVYFAKCLTCITIGLILLHGIPFSIFFDLPPSMICTIYNKIFSRYYSSVYYPVVHGVLPMTIAVVFSFLAFRNVRRIVRRQSRVVRRRLDRQLTAMVLARVACFVVFIVPYTVYRIYYLNMTVGRDQIILSVINSILLSAVTITWFYMNYAVSHP